MSVKKNERISVVLVNYNGRKYLQSCIESIKEQSYRNITIYVVDNCSEDDSVEFLESHYPEVEMIIEKENTGFAKGNNIGIKAAISGGAEYVLLLNVDTVIDKFLVERLLEAADCNSVAVPKIYSDKRMLKVWYAGGEIDFEKGRSFHKGLGEKEGIQEVGFACGCCMLLHKDIFRIVGEFDEKYYLYFEDTDYSMRLRKNSIKIQFVPDAIMWHKIGGSGGKDGVYLKKYYIVRNQLYFIKKFRVDLRIGVIRVVFDIVRQDILKSRDKKMHDYIWRGIFDFLSKNMYRKR